MSNKIDNCKHRSEEQYTRKVKICCNNYKDVEGYDCPLREIFPLNPEHCENCALYQPKEE